MTPNRLQPLLQPRSIALIGASNRESSLGFAVMANLSTGGFTGKIYPVNPKWRKVRGIPCLSSVKKIAEPVDLAVIVTPARTIPDIVAACGEKGIPALLILSAGFRDTEENGAQLLAEVKKLAKQYGIRVIGPNSMGIMLPHQGINASFAHLHALPGKVALISQSGALCTSILDWSVEQGVGFSHFISLGSMMDIGFHDLIEYLGTDPHTSSILVYMESLTEARKFMSAARAFARSKPIIVLKSGRSQEGIQAAFTHTGNLAGNDLVFSAAFNRAGIVRVDTVAQLFNLAQALAMQPRPRGNRLAIITNGGGPAILATDHLIRHGGQLAVLSSRTKETLSPVLSPHWSKDNPLDLMGDATPDHYRAALKACIHDEQIDGILIILSPQAVLDPAEVAAAVKEAGQSRHKTILAAWMGEQKVAAGRDVLEAAHIPVYRYPESAVEVFMKMYAYGKALELVYETPPDIPKRFKPKTEEALQILQGAWQDGRQTLRESEAFALLKAFDLPVVPHERAVNADEAVAAAKKLGYPVVLKLEDHTIAHKSDVGGVKLHLSNAREVRLAFQQLQVACQPAEAPVEIRVLVCKMVRDFHELFVGAHKDPIFGPAILFGQGGIEVDIVDDHQVGLPPLNMALAQRLIEDTRIYQLLCGYRNIAGADLTAIQFLLYKFAYLVMQLPQIASIDLNPVAAGTAGCLVLDATIQLDPKVLSQPIRPYSHLVIAPYPEEFTKKVSLRNGMEVTLRSIKPEDEPLEAALFRTLSNQTIYFRFFGYVPKLTQEMLSRFTQIDYDREIAIVAEVSESGQPHFIGVVRLVADLYNQEAEYSIVIADAWQGQGLGNILTDYIFDIAQKRGVKVITATVLKQNKAMIHMFERRGFRFRSSDFDTYEVELPLLEQGQSS